MKIRNLPEIASGALAKVGAPPRLVRHHEVVHEAACRLIEALIRKYPETPFFNGATAAIGAAIHDIGKVDHPEEMVRPGEKHETAGPRVLRRAGVSGLDEFASVHKDIREAAGQVSTEMLIVALADVIWKGSRDNDLEAMLVGRITKETLVGPFEADSVLDSIIQSIAGHSDQFLEYCR